MTTMRPMTDKTVHIRFFIFLRLLYLAYVARRLLDVILFNCNALMLACRSMCLNEAHSFISSYDPTKIYVFNKKQLTHRQLLLCVQND